MTSIAPPIKWYGGQTYMKQYIYALEPKQYVTRLIPYCGGLSELWDWRHEGVCEIVNDIHENLTNFWEVLRYEWKFEEFKRKVEAVPFSQYEFNRSYERLNPEQTYRDPPNPVDMAVHFFIVCRQSLMGMGKCFTPISTNRTRRGMCEQVSAWLTAIEGLPAVHERLKRVLVLNMDGVECIKKYDGPNVFIYNDPVWLQSERVAKDSYKHEMGYTQHEKLLETLANLKGKFLLLGLRSDLYDSFAKKYNWDLREFKKTKAASHKKNKEKGEMTVCIWRNYVNA